MSAVEVVDLVKTFPAPGGGTLTAVDHVSFSVERGEIFGFLGPTGEGSRTERPGGADRPGVRRLRRSFGGLRRPRRGAERPRPRGAGS